MRKRQQRIKEKGKSKISEGDADTQLFGNEADVNKAVKKSSSATSNTAYFVTVPATPVSHPWFDPEASRAIYEDLESAQAAKVWTYPSNLQERARCATFRKLWGEGMFMGQGIRFGGDFVVYPGEKSVSRID